jgi:hypothetical protein
MKIAYKGLGVALIHILIVLSLGGKLLHDRATRPRIWVRTASFDPDLPIRGRYLTLNLEVQAPELVQPKDPKHPGLYSGAYVDLAVENGQLVAHRSEAATGMMINTWNRLQNRGNGNFLLSPPVVFFIPEHAETPRLGGGTELWAEVTVPKKGPPRPIQLAVKSGDKWTPLTYR